MTEHWRDIAGHAGIYQVSDQGQVRNTQTSKILQPVKIKDGRLYVSLSSDGFQRKCTVHSLVAAASLGDCPRSPIRTATTLITKRPTWNMSLAGVGQGTSNTGPLPYAPIPATLRGEQNHVVFQNYANRL
jgi:hypothetical protein